MIKFFFGASVLVTLWLVGFATAVAATVPVANATAKFSALISQGTCTVDANQLHFTLGSLRPGTLPEAGGLITAEKKELILTVTCDAGSVPGGTLAPHLVVDGQEVTAGSGLYLFRNDGLLNGEDVAGPNTFGIAVVDKNNAISATCPTKDMIGTLGKGSCSFGTSGSVPASGTQLLFDLMYGERGNLAVTEGAVAAALSFSFEYK